MSAGYSKAPDQTAGNSEEVWPPDVQHAGPPVCGYALVPMNLIPSYGQMAALPNCVSFRRNKCWGSKPLQKIRSEAPVCCQHWHHSGSSSSKCNAMHSLGFRRWGREGGPGVWAAQGLHIFSPRPAPWRGHSSLVTGESTMRKTAVTSDKSLLNWHRVWRYGLSSTMGGIIVSHWSAIARLKPGSPRPVRCWPACLLQWVPGA